MRWKGKFLAASVFAIAPFVLGVYGYGNGLRLLWIPALLSLTFLAIRQVTRGYRGEFSLGRLILHVVSLAVLYDAAFVTGWGTGVISREFHCRRICDRFGPVISALEEYRSENGRYPISLSRVPGMEGQLAASGIDVVRGRFLPGGLEAARMDRGDAVMYLDPQEYLCLVPIEKSSIASSRFHAYLRGSTDPAWARERLTWMLRVR